MNILIFDEASWDDRNSFGNTVSNFFLGKHGMTIIFATFMQEKRNLTTRRMLVITTYLPLILLKFF